MKVEIYIDGSCRDNGSKDSIAGIGVVAYKLKPEGKTPLLTMSFKLAPGLTNNEAEYQALYHAVNFFKYSGYSLVIYSDSRLVVNQVNGSWKIKEEKFQDYVDIIRKLIQEYYHSNVQLSWIPREQNKEANDLAQSITEVKNG